MLKQHQSDSCPNCGRIFSSNVNLSNHIKKEICKKKKNRKCNECGYQFNKTSDYNYHVNNNVCKYYKKDCEKSCNQKKIIVSKVQLKSEQSKIEMLENKITDLENIIKTLIETQKNTNVQNVGIQNIYNIKNQQNINITINFGEEGSQDFLCEKLDLDLNSVLKNHLSNCVPVLSKIMHDGEKYPEYLNIYVSHEYPNSAFIWKDGQYIKINKKKAIDQMIQDKLNIFSEYIDTKENINEEIMDKYLDYREKMEDDVNFHKHSAADIDSTLIIIGNQKKSLEQSRV